MAIPSQVSRLDRAVLTPLIRQALDSASAEIVDWYVSAAGESRGAATAGLFRLSGKADSRGSLVQWSLILKVLGLAASGHAPAAREESHPLFWKREALAYGSGLLDGLPDDVVAPRCFGVTSQPDGSIWLWLEDVSDGDPCWSVTEYAWAARRLGRFNGAYAAGQPLPDYPWLSAGDTLRATLEHFAPLRTTIADEQTWAARLLQAAFPVAVAPRLLELWDERGRFLDALDTAPRTLCHKDAWRRNMFVQRSDGGSRLVLVDWSYVGHGPVGVDAADLVFASYSMFGIDPVPLRVLDGAAFSAYLEGLREAGWEGDGRAIRLAYTAYAALKYGLLLLWLPDAGAPGRHAPWESLSGRPMAEFLHRQGPLVYYLLDLADEARGLMATVK